jgi:DNA repair exonuclease SbcCD ATPase subunit
MNQENYRIRVAAALKPEAEALAMAHLAYANIQSELERLQPDYQAAADAFKQAAEAVTDAKSRIERAREQAKSGIISGADLKAIEKEYTQTANADLSELRDAYRGLRVRIEKLESQRYEAVERGVREDVRFHLRRDHLLSEIETTIRTLQEERDALLASNGSHVITRPRDGRAVPGHLLELFYRQRKLEIPHVLHAGAELLPIVEEVAASLGIDTPEEVKACWRRGQRSPSYEAAQRAQYAPSLFEAEIDLNGATVEPEAADV